MVAKELRKELIEAGATLIRKLDEKQLRPDAAFWFYYSEPEEWRLVLAETRVGTQGPREVYRQIQRVLRKEPTQFAELSLNRVALVTPDATLVNLLRTAVRTGPRLNGIRLSNNVVNGTVIDDAYIYRLN